MIISILIQLLVILERSKNLHDQSKNIRDCVLQGDTMGLRDISSDSKRNEMQGKQFSTSSFMMRHYNTSKKRHGKA